MPLFSIVIVNYNHGKYLAEAIESILGQGFTDYELIIIDGGSTDNSVSIIKQYENKLAYWVSEKDKGQSDAFNKGFAKATGAYFFWLNADDILLPGSLNAASNFLKLHPTCKWLACNTITLNKNRQVEWCIRGPIWCQPLVKYGHVYVYGPSSIFHRDLFNLAGGFDVNLNYTMDTDLWYRFVNLGFKFSRLSHYFWGLRIHEESKTSHAFSAAPNQAFANEAEFIKQKNNHRTYKVAAWGLLLLKIITGSIIKAKLDTKIKRGLTY